MNKTERYNSNIYDTPVYPAYYEILNNIATKFNLLMYAPRTVDTKLARLWAEEGINEVVKLRKVLNESQKNTN